LSQTQTVKTCHKVNILQGTTLSHSEHIGTYANWNTHLLTLIATSTHTNQNLLTQMNPIHTLYSEET